jgi:hypothetical protein
MPSSAYHRRAPARAACGGARVFDPGLGGTAQTLDIPCRRRGALAFVTAVALVAAGAFVSVAPSAAGGATGPARWDKRVRRFVEFVEKERGLEFEHPVKVRFLADAEFEAEIRADYEELTEEDRALDAQFAGELVALGLAAEKIDLTQVTEDLDATGTVGYYDTKVEELVVRGTNTRSVEARVTIVHELTHVLQDQHFDLDELDKQAKEGSEAYALSFLVEGDATAVETAYLDSLSKKEQDEYYLGTDDATADVPLPESVPYALELFDSAPYLLGEAYVYALDPNGDTSGRDRAFRHPPKTEELLIDPLALKQRQRAEEVPDPTLAAGEEKAYDPEQFGVITLYLMLSTRLDARTALDAVTGWGGDRYVGFESNGRACVRVNVSGDRRSDTRELERAITAWQATMPAGAVTVSRAGDVVTFTACEAEGVVEPTVETFDSAFYNVLGGRIYTVLDVASADVPLRAALCIGDFVSTEPEVIEIYDQTLAEDREPTEREYKVVDQAFSDAFRACPVS